jgi:serine O-acetyltransferase
MVFDLAGIVGQLRDAREAWRKSQRRPVGSGRLELPSREALAAIVTALRGVLYPLRLGPPILRPESEDYYVGQTLDFLLTSLLTQVRLELRHIARHGGDIQDPDGQAVEIVRAVGGTIARIRGQLDADMLAAYHEDPAARNVDDVMLCYPGLRAMIHHRFAHELHVRGVPLVARILSDLALDATGVDIHPGASIESGFFIDHGTGVVIGETARIGRNVRLYQGVTLGAKRYSLDADGFAKKGGARHPVVEDDVVIHAGATILGRVTIGRGSIIGGNVWLTHSVPAGSRIAQGFTRQASREEFIEDSGADSK